MVSFLQRSRQFFIALVLILLLGITVACTPTAQSDQGGSRAIAPGITYRQLERGDTTAGQNFGDWVVQTSRGLIQDAYVRDNNKLGVVISSQLRPQEVRPLARSLLQGFRRNFPERDLKVLVYAPDKQLILTANYSSQSQQVEYRTPSA